MTERHGHPGHRGVWQVMTAGACASVLLTGCLAQQAELKDVERGLGVKIQKLDQREKDLQQAISRAKQDVDKLVSETRARLSQQLTELREADLPSMQGGLDKTAHQINSLRHRLDDVEHQSSRRFAGVEKTLSDQLVASKADRDRLYDELGKMSGRLDTMSTTIGTMVKTLSGRLDEHERTISGEGTRAQQIESQNRTLEAQNRALTEQMAQHGKALADFKKALTVVGEKLVQEEQRNQELSARLAGRADTLTAKVESDAKTTSTHLNDVNKSVGSVATALETMGGQVMTRVEEQDRRLDDMARSLQILNHTIGQLRTERGQTPAPVQNDAAPQAPIQESFAPPSEQTVPAQTQHPAPPVETTSAPMKESNGSHAQARDAYERYITTFKQGNLDAALQGFSQFLTRYPSSDLAANAQYWLGECYYGKRDYARAIEAFDRVKLAYPASEKVPAALLKKGFAYLAMKDRHRASSVWRQVVDGYPKTPEAGKAMEKLAQLKQIGSGR